MFQYPRSRLGFDHWEERLITLLILARRPNEQLGSNRSATFVCATPLPRYLHCISEIDVLGHIESLTHGLTSSMRNGFCDRPEASTFIYPHDRLFEWVRKSRKQNVPPLEFHRISSTRSWITSPQMTQVVPKTLAFEVTAVCGLFDH